MTAAAVEAAATRDAAAAGAVAAEAGIKSSITYS
jgi:hypothetical protein